jgi:2-polyprenyl-3-methyl-5-hydroxy-6-metoxy-1,4-benzoquinol methylase
MGFSINADLSKDMDGRELLHRFRYHLGRGFVSPGDVVLDAGCGTGYGSELLSQVAKKVIAIDIDEPQILYNKDKWNKDNIEFISCNMEEWDIPEVDVAVAFETIEHTYNPANFVKKLKGSVKKHIIVSVPIGETLIDVNGDKQASGDSTHHSVFPAPEHLDALFIDDNWRKFFYVITGVTYIAVYHNLNQYD